ncbi:MAG TPA: APC family permease [Steroidobacteraceae bacterium]
MTEAARDAGLVRVVGPVGLAASTVNMVVGAGIFALPSAMAAAVGSYAPLAFLACAVAMAAVVLCFMEGGRQLATSGGCYGYIEAAFGPFAGFISGMLLVVGDALACGGVAAALADGVAGLFAPALGGAVHVAVVVGALGVIAAINIRGVASGTRFVGVATVLKLLPLLVFVAAGTLAWHADNLSSAASPSLHGFGRAMILAVFAFTGMEVSLSASGEVRRPERSIPQALIAAMLFVTVLYVAIQIVAQGILGAALASSSAPLADAMAHVHPAMRVLLLAGAALSMFGWLGSDLLGSPRVLFAFGRDGLLPAQLGLLHARTHAPYVAILSYTAFAAVLALTGTFAELAVLATLTSAALYLVGCGAVWILARRGATRAGAVMARKSSVPRSLTIATIVGVTSMAALIALAAWAEIAGLIALVAVSAMGYWVRDRWLINRLRRQLALRNGASKR